MNYILSFILILSTIPAAFCQNWKPLVNSDKYNYQLDTMSYPNTTLWIDSAGLAGSDSVFYINRTLKCYNDDCNLYATSGIYGFILKNQPHFLQKELLQSPNGIYILQNPDTFILHTQDTLLSSWTFNPSRNITATLLQLDTLTIFGNLDSVQIYSLSNGDSVVLSQNNGLIYFPHLDSTTSWNLVGIEGRGLGVQIPKFNDFFGQLNVGDSVRYNKSCFNIDSGDEYSIRNVVQQKIIQQDTIQYQLLEYGVSFHYEGFGGPSSYTIPPHNTIYYYYNTPSHPTNHYNMEIIPAHKSCYDYCNTTNPMKQDTANLWYYPNDTSLVQIVQTFKDANTGLWSKYASTLFRMEPNNDTLWWEQGQGGATYGYDSVIQWVDFEDRYGQFTEYIGLFEQSCSNYHYTIGAYSIGNLQYGTWTGVQHTTTTIANWKLLNNPIQQGVLQFVTDFYFNESTQLQFYNLQGELLHQQIIPIGQNLIQVQLPTIPAGLYLVSLKNGQQYQVFKVVMS